MSAPVPAPAVPSPALPPSTPLRRAARLGVFAAALAALLALDVPLCPVAVIGRVPCPGCGLTRATTELLHGHLAEAVRLHPLAPVVSPLVIALVAYGLVHFVRHGRWPAQSGRAGSWVAAVGIALWALLLGVWLARFHGAFGGPVPV